MVPDKKTQTTNLKTTVKTRPLSKATGRGRLSRFFGMTVVVLVLMLLGPLSLLAFGNESDRGPWWSTKQDSSGIAPDPASEPAAVVQVYGARTLGWRGAFAIHTWIATKRANASTYTIHHVIGWRFYRGGSPVVTQRGKPDFYWFGARPSVLADWRGGETEQLIDQIEQAVKDYPFADRYVAWPGPNSNTFTAFVARQVPALALDLPPTAIGKDYLGDFTFVAPTPSGTGWQISAFGLVGFSAAINEGFEVNLLGLSAGVDLDDLGLRLPGFGNISALH